MIVLDANILIRAVLGLRVRKLLEQYSPRGVSFYTPDIAYTDAEAYLPSLLRKRGKPDTDLQPALSYPRTFVTPVESDAYDFFKNEAIERLQGRDEDDWPVLATAMALSCPVWTEDTDFFGTGIAVWTTNRIEIFLKSHIETPPPVLE